MCPAWHNEDWPDDECDDPAHGCHRAAAFRREMVAKDPYYFTGPPGEPGEPGPARRPTWKGNPARPRRPKGSFR